MFVVCVTIQVLADHVGAFVDATRENAAGTRREPGNVRFDVLRGTDDACRFFLYEVYANEDAFRAHQKTPHYLAWREAVAPWMAVPRTSAKYGAVLPEPWA